MSAPRKILVIILYLTGIFNFCYGATITWNVTQNVNTDTTATDDYVLASNISVNFINPSSTTQTVNSLTIGGGSSFNSTVRNSTIINSGLLSFGNGGFNGIWGALTSGTSQLVIDTSNPGQTQVYGAVSGNIDVIKNGTGVLFLTGANDYTGNTIQNAGNIQGGAIPWGAGKGNLFINGGTYDIANGDRSINGLSNNSGSSAGIVSNTFGVLRTLTLGNNNATTTYDGLITGALISITKTGSGTQTFTNANSTYTGITTINNGVLEVKSMANGGANSAMGAATAANTNWILNGGTLKYSGTGHSSNRLFSLGTSGGGLDASGTGTITLSGAGAMGFNAQAGSRTLTLSGSNAGANSLASVIGDNGGTTSINKTGEGRWDLIGANTATGDATINGGVLTIGTAAGGSWAGNVNVNSAGTLKGQGNISGNVIVSSGGTYSPGNSPGIQNIGGNLTLQSGSTTIIEIDGPTAGNGSGFHDKIVASGTASINGTLKPETIFTGSSGYTPASGTKITMLTSSGLRGQFTSIDNSGNPASVSFLPEYTSTDVNLYVTPGRTWAEIPGLTPSGQQVGMAMEGFRMHGIGTSGSTLTDAQKINRALLGKNSGAVVSAIEQMNPERLVAMNQQALMSSRAMDSMLGNRFIELRSGQTGMSVNGITLYDMNGETVYELVADTAGDLLIAKRKAPKRWGFFASGSGLFEDIESATGRTGYYTKTGASVCGVDYRIDDSWTVGGLLGQSYSITDSGNKSGTVESNSGRVGAFSNFRKGPYYAGGMIGGGLISYDSRRNISFLEERAKGATDGKQFSAIIKSGYDFQYDKFVFGPTVDVAYDRVWIDKFDETGSAARLRIEDQEQESFRTTVGVRGSYPIDLFPMRLIPHLGLGWEREYMRSADLRASFAAGGDSFSVKNNPVGQNTMVVDQGWTLMLDRDASVSVAYQGRFLTTDYSAHGVNVSFRIGF